MEFKKSHNTKNRNRKGFTIIELLVVVSIIAVLAAIVLVNVTQYINRGKNAAIRGNLSSVLNSGAVYYDANASYSGFCGTSAYTNASTAITNAGGTSNCAVKADNTVFCACSSLNVTSTDASGSTFCVDSTGTKKTTATACGTECAAATGACL